MSMINKEISDFRTDAYHENEFKSISKEDILGKWSVFFFYPADFTFVCPTELEDLADKYAQFQEIGCEIYSVSTDTHFVHKAWHDASDRIKKALNKTLESGIKTADIQGTASCTEFTNAIIKNLGEV